MSDTIERTEEERAGGFARIVLKWTVEVARDPGLTARVVAGLSPADLTAWDQYHAGAAQ